MSTIDAISVWGALDAHAVADSAATCTDSPAAEAWGDRGWGVDCGNWSVRAVDTPSPESWESPHALIIEHRLLSTEAEFLRALHEATDRVFDHLARTTDWGLWAESDDEVGYPTRWRPAGGAEHPRGTSPEIASP